MISWDFNKFKLSCFPPYNPKWKVVSSLTGLVTVLLIVILIFLILLAVFPVLPIVPPFVVWLTAIFPSMWPSIVKVSATTANWLICPSEFKILSLDNDSLEGKNVFFCSIEILLYCPKLTVLLFIFVLIVLYPFSFWT